MEMKDIPAGTSWACRFKTTTFLDKNGAPIEAYNLALGQAHPGTPGEYQGVGVIQVRDLEAERVQLQCVESLKQFTVSFKDCWDIDTIEWVEDAK
jgi:hypothetical protein